MDLKEFEGKLLATKDALLKEAGALVQQGSAEVKTVVDGIKAHVSEVDALLSNIQEQIKTIAAQRVPGLGEENKKHPFDFGEVVKAILKEHPRNGGMSHETAWKDAGHEDEMIKQTVKLRSNYAADGTAGGYLIPDEPAAELVDLAMANLPIRNLGAKVLSGLYGDLPIPKKTGRTSAYMVGENSKPTESQLTFGQVWLRPHKAGAFTKQSNRLIYQSRGVSNQLVRDDLAYEMRVKMEDMFLNGSGAEYQPLGILGTSGTTTSSVSLSGARFKIDDAGKMLTDLQVADEDRMPGAKMGFLMHPRTNSGMRRERVLMYSTGTNAAGMPVLANNLLMTNEMLSQQLGVKIENTTRMPATYSAGSSTTCSKVIYGNWDQFYIGLWRDMILKASDVAGDGSTGSALLDDQMYIVLFQEFDCVIPRATAFTIAGGMSTTESEW